MKRHVPPTSSSTPVRARTTDGRSTPSAPTRPLCSSSARWARAPTSTRRSPSSDWVADHGFVGTYAPGFMRSPASSAARRRVLGPGLGALRRASVLALVVHGGLRARPGLRHRQDRDDVRARRRRGRQRARPRRWRWSTTSSTSEFVADLRHRAAMWQLMFGGVFDRHPDLQLMMTEVRGDWIPETLAHLDACTTSIASTWCRAAAARASGGRPTASPGLSFMHKAEIEIRDEIGVDKISSGATTRTPRAPGRTRVEFLARPVRRRSRSRRAQDAGRERHRFFGLDAARIADDRRSHRPASSRTSPAPRRRSPRRSSSTSTSARGYLKPLEGGSRLADLDALLRDDLVRLGGGSSSQA